MSGSGSGRPAASAGSRWWSIAPTGPHPGRSRPAVACGCRRASEQVLDLPLRCDRWGTYQVAPVHLRVRDRGGMRTWHRRVEPVEIVRVHPSPEVVETLVRPVGDPVRGRQPGRRRAGRRASSRPTSAATSPATGPATSTGGPPHGGASCGCRSATPSGPPRWSSSSTRSRPAGSSGRSGWPPRSSTPTSRDRDRVGVVSFGATVSWVRPGAGGLQRLRLIDHLLGRQVWSSSVWKGIGVVPPSTLPPRSLVLAVTPARGRPHGGRPRSTSATGGSTWRSSRWRRPCRPRRPTRRRARCGCGASAARSPATGSAGSGVAVVEWTEDRPVESVLAEAEAFRRRGRRVVR